MPAESSASGLEQFEAVSSIFDAVDIVLYVADFDTHELLFLNARGEQLWGSRQLGRRCYEVLQAGQAAPCAFCTNRRLVEGGQALPPVAWEFQNTANGRWFLCIDKAIRWQDGRLVRMEVAIDITERKAHERFQEQYVGLISHDLRTPLSTITAAASALEILLEHHQLDTSQGAKALGAILRSTRRMSEMIEDLLETTRLESGSIQLHVAQLDLAELAASVIASFPDSPSRPIRLKAEPVTVMADAGRLERVLENLIGNAIRYSPAGTPVQVEVAERDAETVVTVADRGLGIAPAELPKLFERFYRGAHQRSAKGLGLGLYTSRLIIESHRGRIWADSKLGAGSTFGFALPLKRDRLTGSGASR
jgi:two-component system, OmpR family, phosphate regulon sensor histidine kinase PhoR